MFITKKIFNQALKKQAKQKKLNNSFVEIIRNNKIGVFVLTFVITNFLFLFKPQHLSRPEILARNRLQQHK